LPYPFAHPIFKRQLTHLLFESHVVNHPKLTIVLSANLGLRSEWLRDNIRDFACSQVRLRRKTPVTAFCDTFLACISR
jgi:hypothetical protein